MYQSIYTNFNVIDVSNIIFYIPKVKNYLSNFIVDFIGELLQCVLFTLNHFRLALFCEITMNTGLTSSMVIFNEYHTLKYII